MDKILTNKSNKRKASPSIEISATGVVVVNKPNKYRNLLPQKPKVSLENKSLVPSQAKPQKQSKNKVKKSQTPKRKITAEKLELVMGISALLRNVRMVVCKVTENPFYLQINPSFLKIRIKEPEKTAEDDDFEFESEEAGPTTIDFSLSHAWFFFCGFTARFLEKQIVENRFMLLPYLTKPESIVFCACVRHIVKKRNEDTPKVHGKKKIPGKVTHTVAEAEPDIPNEWGMSPPHKRFGKEKATEFLKFAAYTLMSNRVEFQKVKYFTKMQTLFNELAANSATVGQRFFNIYRPLLLALLWDEKSIQRILRKTKNASFSDYGVKNIANLFTEEIKRLERKGSEPEFPKALKVMKELFSTAI